MNRGRLYHTTFGLTLALLLLAACGRAPAEPPLTPVPSTATRPPSVAAGTPTPDFEQVVSIADAVGTWYWLGEGLYLRFYEDGTLHHARGFDDEPYAVDQFGFQGQWMVLRTISSSGSPYCGDVTGIYEVRLFPNYGIQIVAIDDDCSPRRHDTAAMYEAVR
jgi:hypothetical protein